MKKKSKSSAAKHTDHPLALTTMGGKEGDKAKTETSTPIEHKATAEQRKLVEHNRAMKTPPPANPNAKLEQAAAKQADHVA